MPLTILVADDDPVFTLMVATALRKDGYVVVTAVDAMQASRASMKNAPAAMILDVQMPGGTGVDVIKRAKASNLTVHIPIIVVSSLTDPALPERVRAMGADVFLPKPVDLELLRAELRRLLEPPGTKGS
jgi:DNA-binding response OmpR family regulator